MWLIAENFGNEKAKMGLMGGYWTGVLDFGDKLSIETFERHIGVR